MEKRDKTKSGDGPPLDVAGVVKRAIETLGMFQRGDAVLVGASGGPDSMALLHLLLNLAPDLGIRVGAAHLNHAIRPGAADADAAFVERAAERLGLPFFIKKVDVRRLRREAGLSLEEAGRRARYDFFREAAQRGGFNKVALGHHGDDNAELVLMNLFRGSGPAGVSGMPAVRPLGRGGVWVVRPLLGVSRAQLMAHLSRENIDFVTDQSNRDVRHPRNRIRHRLMPELKASYNPRIADALNRFARIQRAENDWMEEMIEPLFQKVLLTRDVREVALSVPRLRGLHIAARGRVLRRAAAAVKGDLRRITLSHVEDVIALMETGPPNGRLALPEGVRVAREGEILRIVTSGRGERARRGSPDRGLPGSVRAREQEVRRPGAAPVLVEMEEMGMALRFSSPPLFSAPDLAGAGEKTGFFDLDALCFPLVIREVRPGDRFCPMGMTGSKKVKKYFIDRKIPGARRGDYPLLVSGDEIVWVIGLRQNESSRVTPATRNLLKVELFLA